MPNFTPNLNLRKPLTTEYYNIADFNDNMDIIDTDIMPKEQYIEDDSATDTTSTSNVEKISMTISGDGEYIIMVSANISTNSGNSTHSGYLSVLHNNSTSISSTNATFYDTSESFACIKKMTLVAGDTISIVYRTSSTGATTTVSNARIYIKEYKGA